MTMAREDEAPLHVHFHALEPMAEEEQARVWAAFFDLILNTDDIEDETRTWSSDDQEEPTADKSVS